MKNKLITIMLVFCLTISYFLAIPQSKADLGDYVIENFESYDEGDTSGSNQYVSWERVQGDDGKIDYHDYYKLGVQSLLFDGTFEGTTSEIVWINLTEDYEYIGKIAINVFIDELYKGGGAPHSYLNYECYTGNGTLVLKYGFKLDASTNKFTAYYWDNSENYNYHDLETYSQDYEKNYWFNVSHIEGNIMNYTVFNYHNNGFEWGQNDSCYTVADWESIKSIRIEMNDENGDTNSGIQCNVDEITISFQGYGYEGNPSVSGVSMEINGNENIDEICYGTTAGFKFTVTGDVGSSACVYVTDPNGNNVFSGCTFNPTTSTGTLSFYKIMNILGEYTVKVVDSYSPLITIVSDSFTVVDCGGMNFTSIYGDFYAEFYQDGSLCYYTTGDNPEICYYFNDIENYTTYNNRYYLDIYRISGLSETLVYSSLVLNNTFDWKHSISSVVLSDAFVYVIRAYNTTDGGFGTYDRNTIIYTSTILEPCMAGDSDGDGVPDAVDIVNDYNFSGLPQLDPFLGAIVGLIVTLMLTLMPIILVAAIESQTKLNINVPPALYALTGSMGVVVSVVFGWFPQWVIFFIVAVGIIMVMLIYYQENKGG